jgi:hypothetical protein
MNHSEKSPLIPLFQKREAAAISPAVHLSRLSEGRGEAWLFAPLSVSERGWGRGSSGWHKYATFDLGQHSLCRRALTIAHGAR